MSKKVIMIMSIFIFLFILLTIITFAVTKTTNSADNDNIEKLDSHIKYLDYNITKLLNEFDDYSSSNFNQVDKINWSQTEIDIQNLYTSWNNIIIDFSNLKIENNYLTDFGRKIDNIMINIQNEDINNTLVSISDLYGFLTKYIEYYNANIILKNNIITKYYLIKSYSLLYTDNWTLISENINNASKSFYSNINMVEISENYKFNLNRTYVAINELKNATTNKNKYIFYIKYKIAIEQINNIE